MVDEMDIKIIAELQKDGRQSNTDLAKKLSVVEGTIRRRINALHKNDILKITAQPNPRAIGYNLICDMLIKVEPKLLRRVANALEAKLNVGYLAFIAGRYDVLAVIMARSSEELSDFIEKEINTIPGVLGTETYLNLDIIKGAWQGIDTKLLITEFNA
jgi:DNA-binding Lrp family transcriptional regulator